MTATSQAPAPAGAVRPLDRRLVGGLFAVYLALLVWLVLFKLDVPYLGGVHRSIKLVPFVASDGIGSRFGLDSGSRVGSVFGASYGFGASAPAEVLANLVIFVPFGVFLGLFAPAWPLLRIVATLAGASLALESAQFVLAVGSSDVTDVIVNTAGGIAGLALLALARRALGVRADRVALRVLGVGTVAAVIASVALLVSPLHYGPPRGGPGQGPAPAEHSQPVPNG